MTLNEEQRMAVECPDQNILVLAAAGSGKTRVVVERYVRLWRGYQAMAVRAVIITYTVAAAKELRQRIDDHPEMPQPPFYVGTLHSFLLRLLRTHGRTLGVSSDITVLDERTAERILSECIETIGWKKPYTVAQKMVAERHATDVRGQALFDLYHRRLEKSQLISYDGILAKGLELLKSAERAVPAFSVLMVDEYQDVSLLDHEIYLRIPAQSRFFVGDKRQAIFGFRGGSTAPIENLMKYHDWTKLELRTNYRSATEIVDAANLLMEVVKERPMVAAIEGCTGTARSFHVKTPEKQMTEVAGIVQTEDAGKSVAIICRYNWHCDEIAEYLRSSGVQVKQRKKQAEPPGWKIVRTLVAFYASPDNDELAYSALTITQGESVAKLVRQTAAAQLMSINRVSVKMQQPKLDEVLPLLVRANVDRQCLDMVEKIQSELPLFSTVSDLAAALQSDYALEAEDGKNEGVTVCTVHASKGLEWDTVILPYFNDEVYPGKNPDNLEESRRLAYVAITRARSELYVFSTDQMKTFVAASRTDPSKPSRFIKEADL